MYKKKPFLITFEGIEGSGKSYQSKKLYKRIKKMGFNVIYTREPGGSNSAEHIRKVILTGEKNKFDKFTDTLLYLASRNEHVKEKLLPELKRGKIIICDRFVDSTIAYQVYGKNIKKNIIDKVHKEILKNVKPNLTFILKLNLSKALQRVKGRKKNNRYDNFSRSFYQEVQKGYIKISKTRKNRYVVVDTSKDSLDSEKIIFKKFLEKFN